MSERMKRFRRAGGLELKKRPNRRRPLLDVAKEAFSHERHTGIVTVSTVPLITERWKGGTREVCAFMVSLRRWITEKELLEARNSGFAFLGEEAKKSVQKG